MLSDAKALFREVADLSPAEREEYYVRRGVPAALREEVASLLRFAARVRPSCYSVSACSTRIIAAAIRSQACCPVASRRRPARVRV